MTVKLRHIALIALCLPTAAQAASCPAFPPPRVIVQIDEPPVAFDTTRTNAALTAYMLANGDAGWDQSDRPDIKGMLRDKFTLDHRIRFDRHADPQSGSACLAIGEIVATLHLQATIYVASGYNRDADYFRRIFTHEDQRITADRALMDAHALRFKQGLRLAFSKPEDYSLPPLAKGQSADNGKVMLEKAVDDSLNVLFQGMIADRSLGQRAIDTAP